MRKHGTPTYQGNKDQGRSQSWWRTWLLFNGKLTSGWLHLPVNRFSFSVLPVCFFLGSISHPYPYTAFRRCNASNLDQKCAASSYRQYGIIWKRGTGTRRFMPFLPRLQYLQLKHWSEWSWARPRDFEQHASELSNRTREERGHTHHVSRKHRPRSDSPRFIFHEWLRNEYVPCA